MPRPDPTVELQALTAMALELTRVDPDRTPGDRLRRWHRELAEVIGETPAHVVSNRELLRDAIRLTNARRESALLAS